MPFYGRDWNVPNALCSPLVRCKVRVMSGNQTNMFDSAHWYDRTTNWTARLHRELPVLQGVFGPPGASGVLDAGCGNGRQAVALAQSGYQVVGADSSADMLRFAQKLASDAGTDVRFVQTAYHSLSQDCGTGFDGLYCIGNSLAAAGSLSEVRQAIVQFATCLRSGGRLFIQILNFALMREEAPCVRGPRVAMMESKEYVSVRHFDFLKNHAQVTNITIWKEGAWKQIAHTGRLYTIERAELEALCERSGLRIDALWGSYAKEPFDVQASIDLILVATRT